MTTPEQDRRMKLAREIVRKHYPEMPNDYSGRRVSIVLDAIQATEARMSAAVEADVEKVARIIDPSSWAVMDGYLSDMLRKYKGQKIGYDPDAFKHKPSMKIAEKVIAAIRSQSNG